MKPIKLKTHQLGMSLVELMVALGVMGIMMSGMITLQSNQQRDIRGLIEQLAREDLDRHLISVLSDGKVCTFLVGTTTPIPSGASYPTIPATNDAGAPNAAAAGAQASASSSTVKVDTITIKDVAQIGSSTRYSANLVITFKGGTVRPLKQLSYPITIQNGTSVSCQLTNGLGTQNYLAQWESTTSLTSSPLYNSSGILGLNTTTPGTPINGTASPSGSNPKLHVGGDVWATKYCDQNGANCMPAASAASNYFLYQSVTTHVSEKFNMKDPRATMFVTQNYYWLNSIAGGISLSKIISVASTLCGAISPVGATMNSTYARQGSLLALSKSELGALFTASGPPTNINLIANWRDAYADGSWSCADFNDGAVWDYGTYIYIGTVTDPYGISLSSTSVSSYTGAGNLMNNQHTKDQCLTFGGTPYTNYTPSLFCKMPGATCPSGWTYLNSWTETSASAAYTCNGNCTKSGTPKICTAAAIVAGHSWANLPIEKTTCNYTTWAGTCKATVCTNTAVVNYVGCY